VEPKFSMKGKKCLNGCRKGKYGELTFFDDKDGTYSCDKCGRSVPTEMTKSQVTKEFSRLHPNYD